MKICDIKILSESLGYIKQFLIQVGPSLYIQRVPLLTHIVSPVLISTRFSYKTYFSFLHINVKKSDGFSCCFFFFFPFTYAESYGEMGFTVSKVSVEGDDLIEIRLLI